MINAPHAAMAVVLISTFISALVTIGTGLILIRDNKMDDALTHFCGYILIVAGAATIPTSLLVLLLS